MTDDRTTGPTSNPGKRSRNSPPRLTGATLRRRWIIFTTLFWVGGALQIGLAISNAAQHNSLAYVNLFGALTCAISLTYAYHRWLPLVCKIEHNERLLAIAHASSSARQNVGEISYSDIEER